MDLRTRSGKRQPSSVREILSERQIDNFNFYTNVHQISHFLLEGEDSATKEGEGHDPMSYERPDQRLRSVKECLFQILHAILQSSLLCILINYQFNFLTVLNDF